MAGSYYFEIDVFERDNAGNHLSYDHPLCRIVFDIIDSNPKGLIWHPQDYGFVSLNPIKKRN